MPRPAPAARPALAVAAALASACQGGDIPAAHPPPPPEPFTLGALVGTWRWLHRATEAGTTRVEDERWWLRPLPRTPTRLAGRYVRTVVLRSDDGTPFRCNQRPWYRQRAVFDVEIDAARGGFAIRELAHRAEPSPCDGGFRRLGEYTARLAGVRLVLGGAGGVTQPLWQTLWQIDDQLAPLPEAPWPAAPPLTGAWRWEATSFDDEGNVRDEDERWEIARRAGGRLDATYRRRVTVRSPDSRAAIPCAGAPRWSFDDAHVLEAVPDGARWRLSERAVTPGAHPCLRGVPARHLDEAVAEQIGDYLVLEWRGKRRQILHRPEPAAPYAPAPDHAGSAP